MVHFVGAGPGAPDLITVRGKQYLEEADVIILPSSIHEVLLFPDHLMFDHAFLCRTVQEINREDVSEEDVLSDRIYIFSRETGTIIPSPLFSCHRPEPAGTESPW